MTNRLMKALVKNLEEYRKNNNLTQNDFAEKLKISTSHYSEIKNFKIKISVDKLEQFSDILKIPASKLIERQPKKLLLNCQSSK